MMNKALTLLLFGLFLILYSNVKAESDTLFGPVNYFPAQKSEKFSKGKWLVRDSTQWVMVDSHSRTWRFFPENPFIRLDSATYNLVYPPKMAGGQLYIPTLTFDRILAALQANSPEINSIIEVNPEKPIEPIADAETLPNNTPKKKIKLIKKEKGEKNPVIIIDPGHGGKDPGAVVGKYLEKTISLEMGLRLRDLLKKKGFEVLMTRDTDKFLTLKDRPEYASKNKGSLFISLHCNSIGGKKAKKDKVSGYVAYILREGNSEEDKALARRENQAIEEATDKQDKNEISEVDWIILEHQLNLYSRESERFAETIVKSFEGAKIEKHRTGAHQAGFFVLVGALMPAVLFEMGFITHDKDRDYLTSIQGQKEITARLTKAVERFFAEK